MEIKDVTSWLGIEADNIESFKEAFAKKYFTEDQVFKDKDILSKFTGKTLGKITNEVSKIAKAHGIEFEKSEIEGKPLEDIANHFFNKQADTFNAKIKELESSAGAGNDERLKEWQSKYEKLEGKWRDTESALKKTAEDYEGYKKTAGEQIKGVKLDYVKEQLWGSASFAPGTDALKIKGFKTEFNEKYKIDLDETGAPYIASIDGKRIQNPNKHSEFLAPQEVLSIEMEKAGLNIKNQQAGRPVFQAQAPVVTQQQPQGVPPRKLSPRATNF
jgi:hypothetical protein